MIPTADPVAQPDPSRPAAGVLIVDDEPGVLQAVTRLLRPDGLRLFSAPDGERALAILEEHAPVIGVVVSDYAMPAMNGADLLRAVRLRWPDITRLLLTGNADLPAAARTVNEGQPARLLTKPWQPAELRHAIAQALEQYHLVRENRQLRALADEQAAHLQRWNQELAVQVAERTRALEQANAQLQQGLFDTVKLLIGFLDRRLPEQAAHCREIARVAAGLADRLGLPPEEGRRIQVAALVHDIGLTSLPDELVQRTRPDRSLAKSAEYRRHSVIGQNMLASVEHLAQLGTWIRHHHERWDGTGYPDGLTGEAIPLASRIIAVADDYLRAAAQGQLRLTLWRRDKQWSGEFDPRLVALLVDEVAREAPSVTHLQPGHQFSQTDRGAEWDRLDAERRRPSGTLRPGLILEEPISSVAGVVLLPAGTVLTEAHLDYLERLRGEGTVSAAPIAVKRRDQA